MLCLAIRRSRVHSTPERAGLTERAKLKKHRLLLILPVGFFLRP